MIEFSVMLRKLERFTITRRPRLSIFQRDALRFTNGDHLLRVRTREFASASKTTAPANLREIVTNLLFSSSH